jgi:hypothetical protein
MWLLRLLLEALFLLLCLARWQMQTRLLSLLSLLLWILQLSVLLGSMHRMCRFFIGFLGILLRLD